MKKNILIFMAILLLPSLALAQAINDGPLQTVAPKLGGINVTGMTAPISQDSKNFLINQVVVDLSVPVYKNFNTPNPVIFKAGMRYQGLFLSGESSVGADKYESNLGLNNLSGQNTIGGTNFHSFTIPLSFTYVISPSTNVTAIAAVGFGSDLKKNLIASDIIYTGGLRMGFHQDQDFKYGVTLVYNKTYSGQYLIPIPDIEWKINDKWNLSAALPIRTSLKYKLTSAQSLGATFGLNAGEYRLNNEDRRKYVQFQQMSGGLIYDLKLFQNWKLNLICAYALMQKLQSFDNDQKITLDDFGGLSKRKTIYSNQTKSIVVQGGISYEF
jgi:hypothetical protein